MISSIRQKLTSFFRKGERALLLEVFKDHVRLVPLWVDFVNKKVTSKKPIVKHHGRLGDLPALLKPIKDLGTQKIFISLGPHLATTIYSSVSLVRNNPKEAIDEADLENLISQAIWRFFDRNRASIAKKMKIEDLDLILTDARIKSVRLDGHKVVNPLGFKAKTIEIGFNQTFLTRECSSSLKAALPLESVSLISEAGSLWAQILSQVTKEESFLVANVAFNQTDVFLSDKKKKQYQDSFMWGNENLKQHIAKTLLVSRGVASAMLHRAHNGEVSKNFKRRFEALVIEELQSFVQGLEMIFKKTGTKLGFIHTNYPLPELMFSNAFKNKFNRSVQLQPVLASDVTKEFGFTPAVSKDQEMFPALAHISEWSLGLRNDKLDTIAKRRVRWLSPLS